MRFSCDECGRSYVASDEVAGRAFRMRCKQCGHDIVVRPSTAQRGSAAQTPPPRSTPPPVRPQAAPAARPTTPIATPAPAAGRTATAAPSRDAPARPAFDPFEGEDVASADVAVAAESLEILERTPAAIRLGGQAAAPRPAPPATTSPRAREPLPQRRAAGRMLPAEDEEMLGPPGQEGRGGVSRWVIAAVVAGLAAIGGLLLRR